MMESWWNMPIMGILCWIWWEMWVLFSDVFLVAKPHFVGWWRFFLQDVFVHRFNISLWNSESNPRLLEGLEPRTYDSYDRLEMGLVKKQRAHEALGPPDCVSVPLTLQVLTEELGRCFGPAIAEELGCDLPGCKGGNHPTSQRIWWRYTSFLLFIIFQK